MAPRNFNTQARLLEQGCTLLLGRNQIVFVSDGKGDTNIWTLGSGVWQWSLGSQHVNDRLCVLCLRALSRQCRAAAQPAACSLSSWNRYRGGPLRTACYTQDRADLCVREVEWYLGYWQWSPSRSAGSAHREACFSAFSLYLILRWWMLYPPFANCFLNL